jgi:flagellar FliL protein
VRTGASEETLDEEFDDEPEAKSGSKKLIIIVGLVLVLLGGGATAAYMIGMLNEFLGIQDATAGSETAEAPPPPVQSVYHPLPTMLANLAGERGQPRVLKFTVSLELTDRDAIPRLRKLEPLIIDILQTHVRELRIDDLRKSRGIPVLRAELLARINSAIHPATITSVLLNEILIQ